MNKKLRKYRRTFQLQTVTEPKVCQNQNKHVHVIFGCRKYNHMVTSPCTKPVEIHHQFTQTSHTKGSLRIIFNTLTSLIKTTTLKWKGFLHKKATPHRLSNACQGVYRLIWKYFPSVTFRWSGSKLVSRPDRFSRTEFTRHLAVLPASIAFIQRLALRSQILISIRVTNREKDHVKPMQVLLAHST